MLAKTNFQIEELEPRCEMQMMGLGVDPGIVLANGTIIMIIDQDTGLIYA